MGSALYRGTHLCSLACEGSSAIESAWTGGHRRGIVGREPTLQRTPRVGGVESNGGVTKHVRGGYEGSLGSYHQSPLREPVLSPWQRGGVTSSLPGSPLRLGLRGRLGDSAWTGGHRRGFFARGSTRQRADCEAGATVTCEQPIVVSKQLWCPEERMSHKTWPLWL